MIIRRRIGRAGRPGLLGTMARTAVVAGTATAVSGGMTRRANRRAMEEQDAEMYRQQEEDARMQAAASTAVQQQQAAGGGGGSDDTVARLEQLADMRERGMLSEEEFAAAKAKLIR